MTETGPRDDANWPPSNWNGGRDQIGIGGRLRAVPTRLPPDLEVAPSRFRTNENKAEELEGLRFTQPELLAVPRRKAAELDQAGLFRMQRQREPPQPFTHLVPEAPGVGLMLEADDDVVGIP